MTEFNPYEFNSAEVSGNQEQELPDSEARFRIAKAMESSRVPVKWISSLLLLIGVSLIALPILMISVRTRSLGARGGFGGGN